MAVNITARQLRSVNWDGFTVENPVNANFTPLHQNAWPAPVRRLPPFRHKNTDIITSSPRWHRLHSRLNRGVLHSCHLPRPGPDGPLRYRPISSQLLSYLARVEALGQV